MDQFDLWSEISKECCDDQFENDKVLIPPETAWFSYYSPENHKTILPANEVYAHIMKFF